MVNFQRGRSDRISALPQVTIEKILTLMPIRDALRTSILSRKWRYSWTTMPKLVFDDKLLNISPNSEETNKYKLLSAIFHVLLLHKGPIYELGISLNHDIKRVDEIDQIILHLSRSNNIKKFVFKIWSNVIFKEFFYLRYKLPSLFFSLHGLEHLDLICCIIELPLTFVGFTKLRSLKLCHVNITMKTLQQLLNNCPLLEKVILKGSAKDITPRGNSCKFLDLTKCLPSVQLLKISNSYNKYLVAGSMCTSLLHLRILFLDVCLLKEDELLFALRVINNSPNLEKIKIEMCLSPKLCGRQPLGKLPDIEKDYSGLKLDHLKELEITGFHNCAPEMAFVKLVMCNSPLLQKAQIELRADIYADEELEMLRGLLRLPFPRASSSANVIIERPK